MPGDGDLYVLGGDEEDEDEGWVSPRPVDDVIVDAVTDATDLSAGDLDDIDAYVDRETLASHLDGDPDAKPLTITVEDHDVTVAPDGTVEVP